jgi:hypothetical protein
MARRRITVQIDGTCRLQDTMQFDQPNGHHREIGHHVVFAERRAHRFQHDRRIGMAAGQNLVEGARGRLVPVPGVVERLDLRRRLRAARRLEQHVVGGVRIERRVEIDEIDAFAGDAGAQHSEIVTIIELVGHAPRRPRIRRSSRKSVAPRCKWSYAPLFFVCSSTTRSNVQAKMRS